MIETQIKQTVDSYTAPDDVPAQMKWARAIIEEAIQVAAYDPDGFSYGTVYSIADEPIQVRCLIVDDTPVIWFDKPTRLYSPQKAAGLLQQRANTLPLPPVWGVYDDIA